MFILTSAAQSMLTATGKNIQNSIAFMAANRKNLTEEQKTELLTNQKEEEQDRKIAEEFLKTELTSIRGTTTKVAAIQI